jgi:two-component system sensor histidine kinase KdpD
MTTRSRAGREYGLAVAIVGVALLLGLAVRSRLKIIDVAMLFLLAVVLVAALTRRAPAILSAVLATAAFDFFFVPPYGTFLVDDSGYFFTFAVMLVVASIMGGLTARIKEAGEEAAERERQVGELYALSRELAGETRADRVIAIARNHLGRAVQGEADLVLARAAQPEQYVAGFGALVIPVWPDNPDAGVAILRFDPETRVTSLEERRTLRLLLDQVAVALERIGGPPAPAS